MIELENDGIHTLWIIAELDVGNCWALMEDLADTLGLIRRVTGVVTQDGYHRWWLSGIRPTTDTPVVEWFEAEKEWSWNVYRLATWTYDRWFERHPEDPYAGYVTPVYITPLDD